MSEAPPAISIISATLNVASDLPHTIASLRAQTFRDFEWIVVDGASTDGTVELLHDSRDIVATLVSEPDRGIYDAWNKACPLARGDWLLFMGAGDELAGAETLAVCAEHLHALPDETGLAYGQLELISASGRVPLETFGEPWEVLRDKWEIGRPALPPHGACFHRRRLFFGPQAFDRRFPIAADSHFMLRYLVSAKASPPAFLPLLVTRSPIGGLSFRLDIVERIQRDIAAINRELGLRPPLAHRMFELARRAAAAAALRLGGPHRAQRMADGLRKLSGKPSRWSVR